MLFYDKPELVCPYCAEEYQIADFKAAEAKDLYEQAHSGGTSASTNPSGDDQSLGSPSVIVAGGPDVQPIRETDRDSSTEGQRSDPTD